MDAYEETNERIDNGEIVFDKFTFYSACEFKKLPELDWRIDEILPTNCLASIHGVSGIGKSFLCLDMAAAVANGEPWFGHETKPCRVVYLALEGQAGIRRRVAAWEKHRNAKFPTSVSFIFDSFQLNEDKDPVILGFQIKQEGGAGLIIIDTLNRAAPNADENRSSDMGNIITGASNLQKMTGASVVLVHHPGKDVTKSLRGHSSLYAALDTVIELVKDGNVIIWRTAKSKDGESNLAHGFTLRIIDIGVSAKGTPIRSCVVQEVEGYTPTQQNSEPTGANQKLVLEAVRSALCEHNIQSVIEGDNWKEGLPFDDLLNQAAATLIHIDQKHRKSRVKEAMNALIRQGHLAVLNDRVCNPPND